MSLARVVRVVRRFGLVTSSPSAAGLAVRRVRLGFAGAASSPVAGTAFSAATGIGVEAALGVSGAEACAGAATWSDATGAAGAACVVVISFSCC